MEFTLRFQIQDTNSGIFVEELYDRANRPENLNVEPEEQVDKDHKGPHLLRSEVEKAIKEMRDKKAKMH
jgi:hypothetical protein